MKPTSVPVPVVRGGILQGAAEAWHADACCSAAVASEAPGAVPLATATAALGAAAVGAAAARGNSRREAPGLLALQQFSLLLLLQLCSCRDACRPRRGLLGDCIGKQALMAKSPSCERCSFKDCCQGESGRHG